MKLKFISCFLVLASALTSFAAADTLTLTNSLSKTSTNTVTGPPTSLGNAVTNSVGMLLIKVSDTLWAGKTDVTQTEFMKIMSFNPSAFPGPANPVDSVSWNDAMAFCQRLTAEDNLKEKIPAGFYYTLPTEEEWDMLMADATLEDAVTSLNGGRSGTSPVGSMKANSLGLSDMRGNVAQWTLGDDSKPYRVLRGGSWQDSIEINLRPIFRIYEPADTRQNTFGFRCVLKKH